VPTMDATVLAKLKSLNYDVTVDPPRSAPPITYSDIVGPNGLTVELTQLP
jgi:hypothetical protein